MSERIEAIISGRVQGVMFRDFACRKARGLKLVGEVQNLDDGTVRVVAEGSRDLIEKYIEKLRDGSLLAHVEDVRVEWHSPTDAYRSFNINYD
ncbi:MAG: acylphosphatase [Candidatus Pacebacteria bacterium]|nr:acylphosphatase [Candidatus Paceibacterota bacterium]